LGVIGDGDGAPPVAEEQAWPAESQIMRLSHATYLNALRDVLAIDDERIAALELPTDPEVNGFDNSSAQPMGYGLGRAYFDNATRLAEHLARDEAARTRIAPCSAESDCLRQVIAKLGRRLYSRPLGEAELDAYLDLAQRNREHVAVDDDFAAELEVALQALLQAPQFLLRLELGEDPGSMPGLTRRNGYEVARALAAMLWVSVPDDLLLDAAASGELDDEEGIRSHVVRMLDDSRGRRFAADMFGQLLHTDGYANLSRTNYPVTPELADAMQREVRAFVEEIVFSQRGGLEALLTAPFTFVNRHNAPIYGTTADGDDLVRVELDPARYAGLLTQSGFMASLAKPTEPHPILRGAHILRDFLCIELVPISLEPEDLNDFEGDTVRERVTNGTAAGRCQACHSTINAIGFAFENFDEVGRWREIDNGYPVDPSGSLALPAGNGREAEAAAYDGAVGLAKFIATSQAGAQCFARKMLVYARGHAPARQDAVLERLTSQANATVLDVVTTIAALAGERRLDHERSASEETCP
jgi:hypothetical protein